MSSVVFQDDIFSRFFRNFLRVIPEVFQEDSF